LDTKLVEAVLRLPASIKCKDGSAPKPLLLRAMGEHLPALVRQRRDKQGFTFPFAPWLAGPLQAHSQALLAEVQGQGWLQAKTVQRIAQDYKEQRLHWSRLWALLALTTILRTISAPANG
jgi:hypothetical protein